MTHNRVLVAAVALGLTGPLGCERATTSTTKQPSERGLVDDDAGAQTRRLAEPRLRGLTVGQRHACAWTREGAAVCWGSNRFGQAGRDTRSGPCRPLEALGARDVTHMAAAQHYTCAITEGGRVTCFGEHPSADVDDSLGPRVGLSIEGGAVEVAAAPDYACARGRDGRVWCWGRGNARGLDDRDGAALPRVVPGLDDATALALGSNVACAATETGPLVCWGALSGLLEAPPDGVYRFDPTPLAGLAVARDPVVSENVPCALDEDGQPWCWLGRGSWSVQASPQPLAVDPQRLSSLFPLRTARTVCGLPSSGNGAQARCWQPLADPVPTPEQLLDELGLPELPAGTEIRAVGMADRAHLVRRQTFAGCLLRSDDGVMCWDADGSPRWRDELAALTRGEWATEFDRACRDVDRDKDGRPDHEDRCPDQPEVYNTVADDDGCPDDPPSLVRVDEERGRIELLEKVQFEFDKATIRPKSFLLLSHLAAAINGHPQLARVEIQGHTDSRSAQHIYGRKPTQRRAQSVQAFLMERGVEADRLTARGYSETMPIADNRTAEGRALNRRIEVVIVEWGD